MFMYFPFNPPFPSPTHTNFPIPLWANHCYFVGLHICCVTLLQALRLKSKVIILSQCSDTGNEKSLILREIDKYLQIKANTGIQPYMTVRDKKIWLE